MPSEPKRYDDPWLDEAIAAGRLRPEPSDELLSMIARMIRPVLAELAAAAAAETKNEKAGGSPSPAFDPKEGTEDAQLADSA